MYIYVGNPVILLSPANQNFDEFSNIGLLCAAVGYPRPNITWLKDGKALDNYTRGKMALRILNTEVGDCKPDCGLMSACAMDS